MRISIRNQLAALVLLSTLVGLAVISIATWVTNHNHYLSLRASRMSTIATLKAAQLSSNLDLMERSVRAMSTRVKLQEGLGRYNRGNDTAQSWDGIASDLQSAMSGQGIQLLNLQTILFPRNNTGVGDDHGVHGILNVTGPTVDGIIRLPWSAPSGGPVYLGDAGTGYPPPLYPNFTYVEDASSNTTTVSFLGETMGPNSALLLGPLSINSTFSLFSVTLPVINNTSETDIIGWMTVVLDGRLVSEVVDSPIGWGNTGTTLLLGPDSINNEVPSQVLQQVQQMSQLPDLTMKFILPPDEQGYSKKRHSDYAYGLQSTFPGSSYQTAWEGLLQPDVEDNSSGANLNTKNEQGYNVAVGFAIPQSNLCTWLLVFEQNKSEAYQLIDLLRRTLLACVFGTAGVMAILIFPIAHFSSRPIRRLRDATSRVANPVQIPSQDGSSDSSKQGTSKISNEKGHGSTIRFLGGFRRRNTDRSRGGAYEDDEGRAANNVPSRVKDGKHFIEDELTDLTQTFNEMSDELALQYARLEERVRVRTAELELSKKAAEAANESKSLFIANISHELKTPLNGILGMTAVCLQEDDPSKIKRSLGIIYKSGDLLHHLLTDLLTFSRNTMAKQLTLDEKEFRIRDIGTQLHAIFQTQATEGQIKFSVGYQGPCDAKGAVVGVENGDYGPDGVGKVRDMVLWGDSQRILQVAINLVSNSLKFTPAGGVVNLSIRCVESTTHAVTSRRNSLSSVDKQRLSTQKSTSVSVTEALTLKHRQSFASASSDIPPDANAPMLIFEFAVEDTGPGIPEHLQSQIFEPFVQGDLRLTKKYGGTGLGLSICSQISQLMHGTLHLKSEVGVGSTFTLRIPLRLCKLRADSTSTSLHELTRQSSMVSRASSPPGEPGKRSESPGKTFEGDSKPRLIGLSQPYFSSGKPPMSSPSIESEEKEGMVKLRVLVAEDNVVNAEVVTRMLKLEEIFDVTLAKDGQEALDKVKESMEQGTQYDLIFMDIQMPNLDGRQSTRLIREAGYSAPIVALTAFSDEINQKECLDSGMDYFLAKPIKRPALKHVLKTYCTPIQEEAEPEQHAKSKNTDFASPAVSPKSTPMDFPAVDPKTVV